MRSPLRQGQISLPGIAFMLIGLTLVIFEMQTGFLLDRIGMTGRFIVFFCGTGFSVWGLKEVIAGFLPGLSKKGYSFKLPLVGIVYLVIMCILFIGSLVGRNNLLLMVFACMAGPFVMNGWITFTMLRLLNVSRVLPERVMAGETFTTSIFFENRKTWLTVWLMTVHDAVTKGDGWMSPEVLFVRVPAGSQRQGHYQIKVRDRGRYQFGPVRVTTQFPLGLVERGNRLDEFEELLVYPRIGHLKTEWRRLLQNSTELVSDVRTMGGPFNDEMSQLREYRQGDDPRMIHWRTSARVDELIVCEYDESRDRNLLLIIDGWIEENADKANFERGLRFATTVCMDHLRNSRESSLAVKLAAQERFFWRGDQGEGQIDNLLDAFAVAQPTSKMTTDQLLDGLVEGATSNRRVVIVTSRSGEIREAIQRSSDVRLHEAQIYGTSRKELSAIFEEAEETFA
ncbi:DUF58 domain-containing protein [Thalassoglobus sp.]|uniref:DUF58 domain-containing protein n=1 Tax=Thalassoglobus sp. TaxID=2795869 RepID=UPI003AA92DC5